MHRASSPGLAAYLAGLVAAVGILAASVLVGIAVIEAVERVDAWLHRGEL